MERVDGEWMKKDRVENEGDGLNGKWMAWGLHVHRQAIHHGETVLVTSGDKQ